MFSVEGTGFRMLVMRNGRFFFFGVQRSPPLWFLSFSERSKEKQKTKAASGRRTPKAAA
jgi:hypothetical protein